MKLAMDLLIMLGGVAVFMYGMKTMGQGMEQGLGSKTRKLFKKINKNRFVDYGIGITATAIVQSSSATSIMTVGLANADVVTVKQGAGIVLGAKVGTTFTAFLFAAGLVSKGSFSIGALFASVAFIGVLIIYTTNNENLKKISLLLIGFGMLFVGMEVMESSIGGTDSILAAKLQTMFQYKAMLNPALLVILGIAFTAIIQSSTAATGIFITLLPNIIGLDQAFFLVMGANIGTCSDGIMASLATNEKGKRIALFHVLTSTMGATFFTVFLAIFKTPVTNFFNRTFNSPALSLATFNLSYNIIYTLVLLVCLNPLVALVTKLIKKKEPKEKPKYSVDERLLATPMIAIEQALKEVYNMAVLADKNLDIAFKGLVECDTSQSKLIADQEYKIDDMTRALASYFIKISSSSVSGSQEKLIAGLHHVINDIERMGDYAVMLAKETNYMVGIEASFLDETKQELNEIYSKISKLFGLSIETFQSRQTTNLKPIADIHYEIKALISSIKDINIGRLSANMYPVEVSKSLYTAFISLQRVADHIVNIAFSIRSDTGSKIEAFANMEKSKKKA